MSATGDINGGSSETLTGGGVGDSVGAGVPEPYVGGRLGGGRQLLLNLSGIYCQVLFLLIRSERLQKMKPAHL